MYRVIYGSQKWDFVTQMKAVDFARLLAESETDTVRVIRYEVVYDIEPGS